MPCYVGL